MARFTGYTLHSIAAYAEGYYSIPLVLTSCTYSNDTFYCYRRDNQAQIQIAHFNALEEEVVFDWIDSHMAIVRTKLSKFMNDIELERLLGEEERIAQENNTLKYDTSMDPISPNFDTRTWLQESNTPVGIDPVDRVREMNELFLDITKETIIGDVIVVPEHRCDIHDTQAQMASQFMAAYNLDVLKAHVFTGMTITFRKAD